MNGGTCKDLGTDFSCHCQAGYTGRRCQAGKRAREVRVGAREFALILEEQGRGRGEGGKKEKRSLSGLSWKSGRLHCRTGCAGNWERDPKLCSLVRQTAEQWEGGRQGP